MANPRMQDVGFYLRLPLELDKRLRAAAAARNGGWLKHGQLKQLVLQLLVEGLDELDRESAALEVAKSEVKVKRKRSKQRLPRKRRRRP